MTANAMKSGMPARAVNRVVRFFSVFLISAGLAGVWAVPGSAAELRRTMSLSATGEVKAEPDMAVVRLSVVREAETAGAALRANSDAMAVVLGVIRGQAIADKDIQTSGFAVAPKYFYPRKKVFSEPKAPRIVGYTVTNSLAIIIRDTGKLGVLLDGVVAAGSNRIDGISFAIAKPGPLRDEARRRATAAVIARAKLYAEAAGVRLGGIISLTERGGRAPQPVYLRARAMAAPAARDVPIARGQQLVTVTVNVVWALE